MTYTGMASSRESLVDREKDRIWEEMLSFGEKKATADWGQWMTRLQQEYDVAARFCLMRLLYAEFSRCDILEIPVDNHGFQARTGSGSLSFPAVTMDSAIAMPPEVCDRYMALLTELAAPEAHGNDPKLWNRLLIRAWFCRRNADQYFQDRKTLDREYIRQTPRWMQGGPGSYAMARTLSRGEAIQLGHMLGLTLEQARWLLLRCFDGDDLNPKQSADLIDAYAFLKEIRSLERIEAMKTSYRQRTAGVEKEAQEEPGGAMTASMMDNMLTAMDQWETDADFLDWLQELAPVLDLPSASALRVYRNLACYAVELFREELGDRPEEGQRSVFAVTKLDENRIYDALRRVVAQRDSPLVRSRLTRDGEIDPKKCVDTASDLYRANSIQLVNIRHADRAHNYVTIRRSGDGRLTNTNPDRHRLGKLLEGTEDVTKADLLYLLWMTLNHCWSLEPIPEVPKDYPKKILVTSEQERLEQFVGLARDVLKACASVTDFYPPHPLEASMMLAILHCGDKLAPAEIYGAMLMEYTNRDVVRRGGTFEHGKYGMDPETLTPLQGKKAPKKNRRRLTQEEIREITEAYQNRGPETSKAFSKRYGIAEDTLYRYMKKQKKSEEEK